MPATVALSGHVLHAKVLLRGEGVVGLAAQAEVFEVMRAAAGERLEMMELETLSFAATDAALVEVSALMFIPLEDGAADARGDVSTAPARLLRLAARS